MSSVQGVWLTLLMILFVKVIVAAAKGDTVSLVTVAEVVILVVSLITYISLIGANGSDPLSGGSTAFVLARTIALTAFIADIIAISVIDGAGSPGFILGFINLGLGGLAVFQGIGAAKPSA
jgi:hypothetical protein